MTKGHRDKLDEEEYDAIYDRHRLRWRRGTVRQIKRRISRRVRRVTKQENRVHIKLI